LLGNQKADSAHPLRLGSGETSPDTLHNPPTLEFGNCAQDMHLELPRWRGGVDAFGQADERHAEGLQVIKQRDQVLQVPAEPV